MTKPSEAIRYLENRFTAANISRKPGLTPNGNLSPLIISIKEDDTEPWPIANGGIADKAAIWYHNQSTTYPSHYGWSLD